jgi:hypothetical protein
MTKSTNAPFIAAPIVELPPMDAADARERAAREAAGAAFFDGLTALPAGTDTATIHAIIERHNEIVEAGDLFMIDLATTGVIDRARFRELLDSVRQARRELLIALGADPDSEDLLAFTAELHDA